jgi:hypothetical protein
MYWVPTVPRKFPLYTRPFKIWSDIARGYPGHLEVHMFQRQREQERAFMWTRRRCSAPCYYAITRERGLDAIHLRHEGERAYFERLQNLQVETDPPRLSPELICFSEPLTSHMWLPPQTPCLPTYPTFRRAATYRTLPAQELRWTALGFARTSDCWHYRRSGTDRPMDTCPRLLPRISYNTSHVYLTPRVHVFPPLVHGSISRYYTRPHRATSLYTRL